MQRRSITFLFWEPESNSIPLDMPLLETRQRIAVLNAPVGYLERLASTAEAVTIDRALNGCYDGVHLFVASQSELACYASAAINALRPGGHLWISCPRRA